MPMPKRRVDTDSTLLLELDERYTGAERRRYSPARPGRGGTFARGLWKSPQGEGRPPLRMIKAAAENTYFTLSLDADGRIILPRKGTTVVTPVVWNIRTGRVFIGTERNEDHVDAWQDGDDNIYRHVCLHKHEHAGVDVESTSTKCKLTWINAKGNRVTRKSRFVKAHKRTFVELDCGVTDRMVELRCERAIPAGIDVQIFDAFNHVLAEMCQATLELAEASAPDPVPQPEQARA